MRGTHALIGRSQSSAFRKSWILTLSCPSDDLCAQTSATQLSSLHVSHNYFKPKRPSRSSFSIASLVLRCRVSVRLAVAILKMYGFFKNVGIDGAPPWAQGRVSSYSSSVRTTMGNAAWIA